MQLVIHPASDGQLQQIAHTLPQSLLLAGERGVGLLTIARRLAGKNLASVLVPQDKKENPDSDNGTISVEMIRRLYDQTRAKHTTRRIIIIDNADRMSRGAQNAFLKLLEEPAPNVHFILTSHEPGSLLPTVLSRVQKTTIQRITSSQTADFIKSLAITDPKRMAQLQFIAAGLPAELRRLVEDEEYFQARAQTVTDARDFLLADSYKKALVIQNYQSDREKVLGLLDTVMMLARRSLNDKPQPELINQLARLLEVRENIAANHNIRLQLMRVVV